MAAALEMLQSPTLWLCVLAFSPVAYLLLNSVLPMLLPTQNLRRKYDAKWALVTGSSSGIGKEPARTLLRQGLDVILVAREEPVFASTVAELTGKSTFGRSASGHARSPCLLSSRSQSNKVRPSSTSGGSSRCC